jgi:hypothetical protein
MGRGARRPAAASPRPVRATAAAYVGRSPLFGLGPSTLAVCVTQLPTRVTYEAVTDHTTPSRDPWPVLCWLHATAEAALAVMGLATEHDALRPFPSDGPAYIDPQLDGMALPHLSALAEHAAATGRRLGVFLRTDMPTGFGGLCHPRARVTVPDGDQADALLIDIMPGQPAATWRHEVGHAFDPAHDQRTSEERESYADALAEHLRGLPADAPLSVITPLAEQVYTEVRQQYGRRARPLEHADTPEHTPTGAGAELPAPGVASLLAFAALPLLAERAA